jgi:hypothetical protein
MAALAICLGASLSIALFDIQHGNNCGLGGPHASAYALHVIALRCG